MTSSQGRSCNPCLSCLYFRLDPYNKSDYERHPTRGFLYGKFIMKLVNAIVLISLLSIAAFAATTGSLRGEIKDPRGYIMYGVTVVARHQTTGLETNAIA